MAELVALVSGGGVVAMVLALSRQPEVVVRASFEGATAHASSGLVEKLGAWPEGRRLVLGTNLQRAVGLAGLGSSLEAVLGWKLVLAVGGAAAMLVIGAPLPLAPVGALVGSRLPDIWVARAARARCREMDREIPVLLDCLVAASSAGLAGPLALRRSAQAVRGALAEELAATFTAVDLGQRWKEALADLCRRLELPDLQRCFAVLTRTEILGVPLSSSLADLASEVRAARAAAASERARTAPVKMLFPLVFLILPAFLLLTVVPVLLSTVRSLS